MSEKAKVKAPFWFLIVAIIALLWNCFGIMAYLGYVMPNEEALAKLTDAQREIYRNMPAWVTGAFAIAVFAGALGSLLLVLRNRLALPLLTLSLVAVIGQWSYMLFMSDWMKDKPATDWILPVSVVVVAFILVGLTLMAKRKRWVR